MNQATTEMEELVKQVAGGKKPGSREEEKLLSYFSPAIESTVKDISVAYSLDWHEENELRQMVTCEVLLSIRMFDPDRHSDGNAFEALRFYVNKKLSWMKHRYRRTSHRTSMMKLASDFSSADSSDEQQEETGEVLTRVLSPSREEVAVVPDEFERICVLPVAAEFLIAAGRVFGSHGELGERMGLSKETVRLYISAYRRRESEREEVR